MLKSQNWFTAVSRAGGNEVFRLALNIPKSPKGQL